jgi:hypothetical protein
MPDYANTIALAQRYLPLLDEVYKYSSRSAVLDNPNVQFVGGNAVKVYKTSMDGLADYSRNGGYVNGAVNGVWETMTLSQDRGRSFQVDAMDNEETLDLAFGTLAGEFVRTKVVPEIDAYTFAALAGATGIQSANADITVGTTDVPGLIDAATKAMNEEEVPEEGRILFVSETAYEGLKVKIARFTENGERNIYNGVEAYNGMRVIRVPQTRFYTAITQYDGTTAGQTAGGYIGTPTTGYNINFLMVHPSAVLKVMKHVLPRIFTPAQNLLADAYKFDYRAYWDAFVYENKAKGVYLHRAATALS